jgi:tetratricopeptide (TPR) repeat protein
MPPIPPPAHRPSVELSSLAMGRRSLAARRALPSKTDERVPRSCVVQCAPWRPALAIFGLALAVRAAHLWQLWPSPYWSVLMGDALAYDNWAQRLAQGGWFGSEVFYQAPLYPYALGLLYALVGRNLMIVRLVQAIVGSLACAALCIAAGRWFGRRAGIASGVILACYGPALFFDSLLQKSVLDIFLLCVVLLLIALEEGRVSIIRATLLGTALGCFALTRENALVFLPIILGWFIWRGHPWVPRVAAVLVGTLVVLAPVAVHNRMAGGAWVLTTSQLGPNLYIGNSETATGTYVALRRSRGNAAFEQHDAMELATRAVGRPLSAAEVSAYWSGRALEWIRTHPQRWLRLTGFKLLLVANGREAADTEDLSTYAEWSWPLRLSNTLANFGVLAPLGVFGVWLTRYRWRQLWVLYALGATYAVSVALFYVLDRYRYPLVPFLTVFAGAAITEAPRWWRTSLAAERSGILLGLATLAVVCNWPIALLSANSARAITHYNLGYAFQVAGRGDDAVAEYRTAERLLPSSAHMHSNLGIALAARGEHDEAIAEYEEAIRLEPDLAEAHNNLGMALASAGQYNSAMVQLDKALTLDPQSVEAHYNRGTALAAQGRSAAAVAEFTETLRLDPTNAAAHNNVGILLASAGRFSSAIDEFRSALRLQPDYAEAKANLAHAEALANVRR